MVAQAPDGLPRIQKINTYAEYQQQEGIPVVRGFAVGDLATLDLGAWARREARGAFVNLDGAGGTNDAYVLELGLGHHTPPQHQLFEEMVFVLDGAGATSVWYDERHKTSFEWKKGSLFAIPLNAWHQHFNLSGLRPARFVAVTTAPMVMNLFHNLRFVFETPFTFDDRFDGRSDYFEAEGTLWDDRVLETNFVDDVAQLNLYAWKARGAGGAQVRLELAHNTSTAHVAQFPVGTYKKAHRHGPGAHLIVLGGQGYSLLWPQGGERRRVDWGPGTMVVPPLDWFHQHFNSGATPARYLALRWGSRRYDMGGVFQSGEGKTDVDVKAGGAQIEYPDEDREIHHLFEAELTRSGAKCRMRGMVPWCTGH